MMILRSALPSPFGRKVKIAAGILKLDGEIDIQPADTNNPDDSVRKQNPLGKIPVLVAEDGTAYYDSRVILEYLDHRAGGGKIFPRDPEARLAALRLQALCDGVIDASLLIIYEARYRPADKHVQSWLDYQAGKVERGLAALEADPPGLDAMPHVGQITAACMLGYRDFRFQGTWRKDHPRLVAWLDRFAAAAPAYDKTKPPM
jgi:glutathione S-transferase